MCETITHVEEKTELTQKKQIILHAIMCKITDILVRLNKKQHMVITLNIVALKKVGTQDNQSTNCIVKMVCSLTIK